MMIGVLDGPGGRGSWDVDRSMSVAGVGGGGVGDRGPGRGSSETAPPFTNTVYSLGPVGGVGSKD